MYPLEHDISNAFQANLMGTVNMSLDVFVLSFSFLIYRSGDFLIAGQLQAQHHLPAVTDPPTKQVLVSKIAWRQISATRATLL